MSIGTKLKANAAVTIGFALLVALTIFISTQNIEEATKDYQFVVRVTKDVSDLNSLSYAYLLLKDKRPKAQWQLKHTSLGKVLSEQAGEGPEEQALIASLRTNHEHLKRIFDAVSVEGKHGQSDIKNGSSAYDELNEGLTAELMRRAEVMSNDASLLGHESGRRLEIARRSSLILILASAIFLILSASTGAILLIKSIGSSIRRFDEGTKRIAAGDLDYRVEISGTDEIARLSRAFNEMAEKLSASYDSLEEEIAGRTRAQEALEKAHKDLERQVEERTAALRESEQRLALAAAATQIGMFDWDLVRGRILWTQSHETIFGYLPTTAITAEYDYHRWADRVHPEDLPVVEEESRRCMQHRIQLEIQYRIIWPDGSLHWVETRGVFLYDEDGKANRMLGVVLDITERRRAEEIIARQTALLTGINRILNEIIISQSVETLSSTCLSVAEELTDSTMGFIGEIVSDGELHDITMSTALEQCAVRDIAGHSGILEPLKIHGLYGHVLKHGTSLLTNDPASHPDSIGLPKGHPPLTAFLGVPLAEKGKTIGLVAVGNREGGYRNEQQQMLESLAPVIGQALLRKRMEEVNAWLAAIVESSDDAIIGTDLNGTITSWNKGAENIYGYDAQDIINKSVSILVPADHADELTVFLEQIKKGKGIEHYETVRLRKDDRRIHISLTMSPMKDSTGNIIGASRIARDITDRKRAEAALHGAYDELEHRVQERTFELQEAYEALRRETNERQRAEEQLRQSQKMEAIGTLAGGIAHDFNNILAAILGFTEMAIDDSADRLPVDKSLKNIHKSALRARDLVKQILAFSRKTNYERAPLSPTPIIKETVQLLRASIPASIEIKLSIETTSDTIVAAPTEVQQIVMNLATNASLAMAEKGGTLEIHLTDFDVLPESPVFESDLMPGEYVRLMVKDTGTGMGPDVKQRAFEPFFTTRELGAGTGMGLAVVYGIVTDLEGTITVESEPGIGSTFRVFLPKAKTEVKEDQAGPLHIPPGTESILFVDDEDMLVVWAKATLEKLGYRVIA